MSNNASLNVSVYPTIELVTNLARSIINDAFTSRTGVPGGGRIMTDNSSFIVPYLNASLLEVQQRLRNNNVQTFTVDNITLTPIVAVAQLDPSVQVSLTFTGYYNGTTAYNSPQLPRDMIVPEKLWARVSGSGLPFKEMMQPQEGIQSCVQGPFLTEWEWRTDGIYMAGATQNCDIRIRYKKGLPYFTGSENFKTTVIPLEGCVNVLAYMVASKYAMARGAADVSGLDAAAEKHMLLLIKQFVRQRQSVNYTRPGYGDANGGSGGSQRGW